MLIGKNIYKAYGDKKVLTGVNANIEPGQIAVLIGPSGMGKSTLLRALSLLDPPDKGTVTVDGTAYTYPEKTNGMIPMPWPKLTVVFQQLFLWPHLTIRKNIALPLTMANGDIKNDGMDELITLFEMETFIDRYPNEVSLGQRQLAAIARAIALDPKYLLLDEITSALDVEYVSKVLGCLKKLRERGTGILIVTHLIGFAKSAADQVIFLDNGTIIESGKPEMLSSPKSKRLAEFLSLVVTAI
jgi:ABC-type polar amino acid transport system ATPase subunit